MKKKIRIIVWSLLIVSSSSLGAYAYFDRADDETALPQDLDTLIKDSMCKARP